MGQIYGGSGDLGDLVGLVKLPKFLKMRYYNTLTWSENFRNPISKDLNLKYFPGKDAPRPPYPYIKTPL